MKMLINKIKNMIHSIVPGIVSPAYDLVESDAVSRQFARQKIKELSPKAHQLYLQLVNLATNRDRGILGYRNLEVEFVERYFKTCSLECSEQLNVFLLDTTNEEALHNTLNGVNDCNEMWHALEAYYWKISTADRLSTAEKEWWRKFCYVTMKDWLNSNITVVKSYGLTAHGYRAAVIDVVNKSPTLKGVVC